ncbi:MAG: YtxH domain-containing protein [Polyangiaceae bacterium]
MKKIENTKEEAQHKAAHLLSTVVRGVEAAATVGTLMRYFDRGSMLEWVGFRRRRSVWGTIGLIGVGAIAGAGLSMFLSPMSGRETRENLARGVKNLGQKGKEALESAEREISELTSGEHGAEGSMAGKGRENRQEGGPGSMRHGDQNRPGENGIGKAPRPS